MQKKQQQKPSRSSKGGKKGSSSGSGSGSSKSAPSSISSRQTSVGPKIMAHTRESFRFQNRELVSGSVLGSVAFSAIKFALNPGIAASFPWLNDTAASWEHYKFHSLVYEFVPSVATTTAGDIMLVPDYDPSDGPPTTEAIAGTYHGMVMDRCYERIGLRLDPKAMHALGPRKYTRTSATASSNLKMTDVGNLYLCAINQTGASAVGKLFVDYDVEFFVPQDEGTSSAPSSATTSHYQQASAQTFTTAVGAALQWDAPAVDPLSFGTPAAGVFTPPAGSYRLGGNVCVSDSSAEAFTMTVTLFKNGAVTAPIQRTTVQPAIAGGAAQIWTVPFNGILNLNGSDTCAVVVTLTGAAGTLTSVAAFQTLLVTNA